VQPQQPGYGQQYPPPGQQPGYGQPGYPQQPPGPPGAYPPYGPGGPGGPGGRNNRTAIIAAVVAVLVIGGGLLAFFLLSGGDDEKKPVAKPTGLSTSAKTPGNSSSPDFPSNGPSQSAFPSETSLPTGSNTGELPSEDEAHATVKSYLQAVANENKAEAEPLICESYRSGWESGGETGAFDAGLTSIDFKLEDSNPTMGGLEMRYTLKYELNGSPETAEVTFLVAEEGGKAKICGITDNS
jgi:hypothetical protein